METKQLQTNIIRLVLDINDMELLTFLNNLLNDHKKDSKTVYKISETEKAIIKESISAYKKGDIVDNEDIANRNKLWLGG